MADGTSTGGPRAEKVIHEYDGIEELDNALPRWWVYVLFTTMAFALGYWFWFQVFQFSPSPTQAYHAEMQDVYAAEAARLAAEGAVTPEALIALSRDDATVARGHQVFTTTCQVCHGPNGGGNIGPNLTDSAWLYGGAPDHIYHTVTHGTPRGMPVWGPQLGPARIQAVVAYLLTIRDTNVAGGKPPQGTPDP
jgi:cytochrome c oxidase cbb3-type subunit 3